MLEQNSTIFIIESDPDRLHLLQCELRKAGYGSILTASTSEAAWQLLQHQSTQIDAILLDQTLSELKDRPFLDQLKSHPDMRHIPVIVQSCYDEQYKAQEPLRAGAYYYLFQPLDPAMLITVLSGAIRDSQRYRGLLEDMANLKKSLHALRQCYFCIRTLDEATYMGRFLAYFFPDPERTAVGLTELLINAVEHGNLGISYLEKGELIMEGNWREEVDRRLSLEEYRHKQVHIFLKRHESSLQLRIKDDGSGFDWERYLTLEPHRLTHTHGRGIAIARTISFDQLEFLGDGNVVQCTNLWPDANREEEAAA